MPFGSKFRKEPAGGNVDDPAYHGFGQGVGWKFWLWRPTKDHWWGLGRACIFGALLLGVILINWWIDRWKKYEIGGTLKGGQDQLLKDGLIRMSLPSERDYAHILFNDLRERLHHYPAEAQAVQHTRDVVLVVQSLMSAWIAYRDPHAGKRLCWETAGYIVLRQIATLIFWESAPVGAFVSESADDWTSADTDFFFSGHTASSWIFSWEIMRWFQRDWLSALTYLGTIYIFVSQIILGVHWFSDVFTGTFVGWTLCLAGNLIELRLRGVDVWYLSNTVGKGVVEDPLGNRGYARDRQHVAAREAGAAAGSQHAAEQGRLLEGSKAHGEEQAAAAGPQDLEQGRGFQGAAASPHYQGTAPNSQGTAPNSQGTAPNYQGTAPNYQGTAPNYQGTAPSQQTLTAPHTGAQDPEQGTALGQQHQAYPGFQPQTAQQTTGQRHQTAQAHEFQPQAAGQQPSGTHYLLQRAAGANRGDSHVPAQQGARQAAGQAAYVPRADDENV